LPNILSSHNESTLRRFALSDVVVGFDYDGTLAPITATPDRAQMRPSTRRLLHAVARRYPCVIISGRSRADLAARIGSVPVRHLSGNHGIEPWGEKAVYAARVARWVSTLRACLAGHAGVFVEQKTYSLTVHYRTAREKARVIREVHDAVRSLRGTRVVAGSQAVNVVPTGAPHKGVALRRVRQLLGCDLAIFVGDDDTDEDAFGALPPSRLLSVHVGARGPTLAPFRLKNQLAIDDFLAALLALRPGTGGSERTRPT
jgi:trehalose 6-phosphate phosphatase